MNESISRENIRQLSKLAKLSLSEEEQIQARKDMDEMLAVMSRLQQLDTDGIEPMSHVFPVTNVYREDNVTNGDERDAILGNAPAIQDGFFKVPSVIK